MKKIFTVLIILFCLLLAKDVSAQYQVPHKIPVQYVFQYPTDASGNVTINHPVKNDTLLEGSEYSISNFNPLPESGAPWADAFRIFANSTFKFELGSIPAADSVILIKFLLSKLQPGRAPGSPAFQKITDISLWMYLEISVTVYSAGTTKTYSANQSYPFVNGKYAILKVPISTDFENIWKATFPNEKKTDINFSFLVAGAFQNSGLITEIDTVNKIVTGKFTHFSKIGGGGRSLSISGVEEKPVNSLPGRFDLAQNYPNPFNPTTRIAYSIPSNGFVTLKVYNAIGTEVSTLASGYKNAGTYEVSFDGGNMPSGMYFYSLNMNGKVITNKMMLIK